MIRAALDVRPHIKQKNGLLFGGKNSRQGRTFNSGNTPENEHAASHRRAGMPRADNGVGLALFDQTTGDLNGGILFGAQYFRRLFAHFHYLGGVDNLEKLFIALHSGKRGQGILNRAFLTDQKHFGPAFTSRLQSAGHHNGRTEIPPHGINGDDRLTVHSYSSSVAASTWRPLYWPHEGQTV